MAHLSRASLHEQLSIGFRVQCQSQNVRRSFKIWKCGFQFRPEASRSIQSIGSESSRSHRTRKSTSWNLEKKCQFQMNISHSLESQTESTYTKVGPMSSQAQGIFEE